MIYDVIIVGSGPAGISASLYTKRANLETLIISKGVGTLEKVSNIENYYGINANGLELQQIGEKQAENLGIEIKKEEVMQIEYDENYIVKTLNHIYEAKTVILATGSNRKTLKIKGIKEPIRLKLLFKEPVEGKLTLHSWSVIRSDIKIGDGRKE